MAEKRKRLVPDSSRLLISETDFGFNRLFKDLPEGEKLEMPEAFSRLAKGLRNKFNRGPTAKCDWVKLGLDAVNGEKNRADEALERFREATMDDVENAIPPVRWTDPKLVENVATHEGGWSALAALARFAKDEVAMHAVAAAANSGDWNAVIYAGCYGADKVARQAVDAAIDAGKEDVVRIIAAQYVTAREIAHYARRKQAGGVQAP